MAMFTIYNGPMPTSASQAGVSTSTNILTMLQILPTKRCRIMEWGISFVGAAVAAGVEVELLDTAAIFATVTASVDADIYKVDGGSIAASTAGLTLGTAATGYTASAEGTVAATRILDAGYITPTNWFHRTFATPREAVIGNSTRIRVKAAAGVLAICYMTIELP
jgi:hypothetical protein